MGETINPTSDGSPKGNGESIVEQIRMKMREDYIEDVRRRAAESGESGENIMRQDASSDLKEDKERREWAQKLTDEVEAGGDADYWSGRMR